MPGGQLPEGLVTTNNETVREEIGNVDRVDLKDVARLWRDYSTSRALLHDNTGERLANFFWRIWSNPAISKSIPGSTVARLFMTMSEGGNRVRTTPIPSPRSTSPLSHDTTPTPSSPQALAELFPTVGVADAQTATSSSTGTVSEPASDVADTHAPSARSRLTLKKAGPISDSPSTSKKSPTSPSGTTSPISPTNAGDRSLSNGNRKRASHVTAGGARAKTRPSLPRRKSNQGPSLAVAESKKSPRTASRKSPPRTPPLQQAQARPTISKVAAAAPPSGLPSLPSTTSSFALPSASWQDVSSPTNSQVVGPSTAATSQQPSSWLVDSNFRSKFVESLSRGVSSTNLSGLGKSKSTVRFADQLPGRRATSGAVDRQTTAPAPNTTPDAALTNAQARTRRGSGAIVDDDDDEDDDDILPLPRTKSQLSLMIDQERRKSGAHELRPSPLQQEVHKEGGDKTASKPKDNDNDDDDDDDADDGLLTMGRKDGVTRAGAIGGKAQGKQKMSLKDNDKFLYQSPPTPPLY